MVSEGDRKRGLPWILLGLAMATSATLILSLNSGFTFITDEWDLLLLREGWGPDVFLAPFHEHIVVAPAFIYKALQAIFGMESPRPMQVAAVFTFLASVALLFLWLRPRTGDWAALIGAVIVLFLGAAFEDLLWAFQIGYFGALACGLGALVALDRNDRRGDIVAAVLLVGSVSFSSLGMPFVAGAALEWILNPRDRRRRWFVPGAALAFYLLWWLGWGSEAESAINLANVPYAPKYFFDAASAAMTSMLGLATGDGSEPDQPHLIWGRLALVVLLALSAWRLIRLGRIPRGFLVVAAIAVAFFGLASLGQSELRPPTSSRYQLPAVVFILLVCGEVLRGLTIPRWALAMAAALVLVTSISGVALMREQAEERWQPSSQSLRVSLGAIVVAGESAREDYVLDLGFHTAVPIARFREEVAASGSPGYAADELPDLDPAHRGLADAVLIDTIGIRLSGLDPGISPGSCRTEALPAGAPFAIEPSFAPLMVINPGGEALPVSLARFGDPPGMPVGSILPRSHAWLTLPPDGSSLPWQLTSGGAGQLRICP